MFWQSLAKKRGIVGNFSPLAILDLISFKKTSPAGSLIRILICSIGTLNVLNTLTRHSSDLCRLIFAA